MTKVKIPSPVQAGTRVMLSCFFDLAWGERVYIVNWYRNGKEFYRFSPSESPSIQTFSRPGIFVDTFASNMTTVVLRSVPLNSAGRYRCEIATEAPSYVTVHGQRYMSVVDLPSEGPKIAGARDLYRIGEPVSINCTSARSRPAASLTWYINGEQADPSLVEDYPIHRHMDGLETSKISLKFRLRHGHLRHGGGLKIKCAAEISSLYWKTHEREMWARAAEPAGAGPFSDGVRLGRPGSGGGLLLLLLLLSLLPPLQPARL
ncbi:cell adhesion molecule 1-like [Pollicipes pollicipes]|uniref:cell adhesion molecule 1-like n=1 Tax=Pollicipes pollicipes TaxID=41117 RepID=UPI0018855E06|nr:cell adhesion molecule 1-like [Pollicipes pollicipes]